MAVVSKLFYYITKNKKIILLLITVIIALIITYYTFNVTASKHSTQQTIDYNLSNNHAMNIVPNTKEGFQESTTTTSATPTLAAEQLALCPTQPTTNISAVRSLYSGATFKLETISPSKPEEVFICGPGNFVVELLNNASNSLKLAVKDTSGNNLLQKFIKQEKTNPTDTNGKCIVFNAYNTSLYVQYEHEHLSLRPLNTDGKPFLGQCFVAYNASPSEIEAHALAIGISKVGMDGSELIDSGIVGSVNMPNVTNSGLTSTNELQKETDAKYTSALAGIMDKINLLSSQLQGNTVSGSVFGNKDAIKINVNLAGSDKDGFTNISNRSTFQDIASSGSGTATVSQLLDQYLMASGDLELGNIPNISTNGNLLPNGLLEIKKTLQSKFKGCPSIDRNLYYTERQLAQCSGCNPDAFLRGQLGGLPKLQ